jgi:hypothetical protein
LTTDSQRRANRANAKSSTGPKTAAGKARAAQNAASRPEVPISSDPALSPLAQAIANRIPGPDADEQMLEHARRIAEAQVDLNRVRNHRRRLIAVCSTAAVAGTLSQATRNLPRLSRRMQPGWPRSIGTSDALCRDANPQSACLMQSAVLKNQKRRPSVDMLN